MYPQNNKLKETQEKKIAVFCIAIGLIWLISIVSQGEYIGEIKGGLRPSMKLVVMGIVDKKAKRLVHTCFHFKRLNVGGSDYITIKLLLRTFQNYQ